LKEQQQQQKEIVCDKKQQKRKVFLFSDTYLNEGRSRLKIKRQQQSRKTLKTFSNYT
jgi:hypothetical protein